MIKRDMNKLLEQKKPFHVVVNNVLKSMKTFNNLDFKVTESKFASGRPIATIKTTQGIAFHELEQIDQIFNVSCVVAENDELIIEVYGTKPESMNLVKKIMKEWSRWTNY